MNRKCRLLAAGIIGLAGMQAAFAVDFDEPQTIAQARGTAGAAGTGAGSAASPGPATGRNNAAVPGVPPTNRPGTGANNSGVTANDPAATTPPPSAVPPADATTALPPPATVPPGEGVTVHDPLDPNMPGRLDNPNPAGNLPSDRQRMRDAGRPGNDPNSTAGRATSDQDFAAALRSCDGLPGGERSACQAEARRIHGRM